jgi:carbamoyltransferase
MKRSCILSFASSGHGFSGALCVDGEIIVATSLERITRKKNDILLPISKFDLQTFGWNGDPENYKSSLDLPFDLDVDSNQIEFDDLADFKKLVDYLLIDGDVSIADIDCVVYGYRYNKHVEKYFKNKNPNIEFLTPEHHFSHACQAFLPSPYEEAAIMVVDGQGVPLARKNGDPLSGCLAYGKGNSIETLWELPVRHSLGGFYAAFTKKIGFKTNEEGKTMGLAPYGNSDYYDILKKDVKFNVREYNVRNIRALVKRAGAPEEVIYQLPNYINFLKNFNTRIKGEDLTDVHRDLAYAVQKLTEDVMVFLADWLYEKTGSKNLCIAGGVGLNCVANYQVLIRSKFDNIFVHPNPGDNGLAIGQALYAYSIHGGNQRKYIATHDYLGRQYPISDFHNAVQSVSGRDDLEVFEYENIDHLYDAMAKCIADGKIASWCQGRSEFGPRALGNRSILADPRRSDMKDILNSRVKFRESFRPFTPSVLFERSSEFFELDSESPFMLMAAYVKEGKGNLVPAITHADNTARVQTVTRESNERYYGLIKSFEKLTGIPMVLDTSFNIADEPIVETPADAIRCFLSTDIDVIGIDKFLIVKHKKTHISA